MPKEILLPSLSPDSTKEKIASWSVQEGDVVKSGDVLLEIETDKAILEVESEYNGTLGKILVAADDEASIGECIAIILQEGETANELESFLSEQATNNKLEKTAPINTNKQNVETGDKVSRPSLTPTRVFASPSARRLAIIEDIDLNQVVGTGPNGRIVKKNILEAAQQISNQPAPISIDKESVEPIKANDISLAKTEAYDIFPNSGMRKVIAKRLGQAKRDIPHFYLNIDVEIDNLLAMRKELNQQSPEGNNSYKISVNDFVVKASALALKDVPEANASWTEEAIHRFHNVDISIAVATDSGLITPIVTSADQKGLMTLSNNIKALAKRAQVGGLKPHEYQGGGFTISNLGMFGIKQFSAIVNPPQSCILAVGAGMESPIVKNHELTIATVMTCTLSVDHRAVDGAVGARFLAAFKSYIENPVTMIL